MFFCAMTPSKKQINEDEETQKGNTEVPRFFEVGRRSRWLGHEPNHSHRSADEPHKEEDAEPDNPRRGIWWWAP
jgi:hypothetical protein